MNIFCQSKLYKIILFFYFFIFYSLLAVANPLIKITIIGDSLTEGYGIKQEKAYPRILEQNLLDQGYSIEIINAGSSGSTSASALKRVKWHLRGNPQIIMLALGANDGLRGIATDTTKKNLQKAIEFAQTKNVQVILAGMKLPYNYGQEYRTQFENIFRELSKINQLSYIPFLLKDVGGIPSFNLSDGIHPNEKGHQKIADNLFPVFNKILLNYK